MIMGFNRVGDGGVALVKVDLILRVILGVNELDSHFAIRHNAVDLKYLGTGVRLHQEGIGICTILFVHGV